MLCQFGDGAVDTGAFHEALNLAGVWDLPIVFQVINNQYGMGTSVDQSSAEPDLWKRAAGYRMHGERVDGNDVLAVREAAARLLAEAREQRRPALLETVTYRYRGHSVADAGKVYRTAEEIESWRRARPDHPLRAALHRAGAARRRARSSRSGPTSRPRSRTPSTRRWSAAFPDVDTLYEHVYGDAGWHEQFAKMQAGAPFGERGEERTWQT